MFLKHKTEIQHSTDEKDSRTLIPEIKPKSLTEYKIFQNDLNLIFHLFPTISTHLQNLYSYLDLLQFL